MVSFPKAKPQPVRKPMSSVALDDDDIDYAVVKPHKTITLKADKSQKYRDLLVKCQFLLTRLGSWKAVAKRPDGQQINLLLDELQEALK